MGLTKHLTHDKNEWDQFRNFAFIISILFKMLKSL